MRHLLPFYCVSECGLSYLLSAIICSAMWDSNREVVRGHPCKVSPRVREVGTWRWSLFSL